MRYPRMVSFIAFKTGSTYETTDAILKEFAEVTKKEVLENKGEVRIPGFGKFWPRHIKGKGKRKIGEMTVEIPEQVKVSFKAFKDAGKEVK